MRECGACHARLPVARFRLPPDATGHKGYSTLCRECRETPFPPDSPWCRAEREVERRYGLPRELWLNSSLPLSLLHTALAIEYAREDGITIPHTLTVEDCELLCTIAGFQRIDTTPHHQGESHEQQATTDSAAA